MCKVLWRHREGTINCARAHRRAQPVFETDATSRHQSWKTVCHARGKKVYSRVGTVWAKSCEMTWSIFQYSLSLKEDSTGEGKSQEREAVWNPSHLPYLRTVSPQGQWRALPSLHTTVLLNLPYYLFFAPVLSVCFRPFPFVSLLFSSTFPIWF